MGSSRPSKASFSRCRRSRKRELGKGGCGNCGNLPPAKVSGIQAGIHLVLEYFWPHTRAAAALRQIGLTDRHSDARQVLRWIRTHGLLEVSREEIRRDALSQRLDAEQTDRLLEFLVKVGFLRKVKQPAGPHGGRPTIRWEVYQWV